VDQKPRVKSQKKFNRKPIKSNNKEINVMVVEEITTTTETVEEMEGGMIETIIEIIVITGATKKRIKEVKSSSRKTNLVTTVDMEAVAQRREITIKQTEQVEETAK